MRRVSTPHPSLVICKWCDSMEGVFHMAKFKYNSGDKLGPNKILMIERLYKTENGDWIGKFECPECHRPYDTYLDYIVGGKVKQRCPKCQSKIRSSKIIDLTGMTFGELTPIELLEETDTEQGAVWLCQCTCGRTCKASRKVLMLGEKKSCGHARREDITGQRFGKLVAIEPTDKRTSWGSGASVVWKCHCDCGNDCEVDVHSLKRSNTSSCGCLVSKGEEKIKNILKELNIFFVTQYAFENCINPSSGAKLKFDFYLPDLNLLIEYDGAQHYIVSGKWNDTAEELQERQKRDRIKDKFCLLNGYQLIRIPYWDYNKINSEYITSLITG